MNQPVIFVNITSGLKADFAHLIFNDFLDRQRRWFQAMQQLLAADFRREKTWEKSIHVAVFFWSLPCRHPD